MSGVDANVSSVSICDNIVTSPCPTRVFGSGGQDLGRVSFGISRGSSRILLVFNLVVETAATTNVLRKALHGQITTPKKNRPTGLA